MDRSLVTSFVGGAQVSGMVTVGRAPTVPLTVRSSAVLVGRPTAVATGEVPGTAAPAEESPDELVEGMKAEPDAQPVSRSPVAATQMLVSRMRTRGSVEDVAGFVRSTARVS